MGVSFTNKKPRPAVESVAETPVVAKIRQSVGLQFSNGYEFQISYDGEKMLITAEIGGKEAFFLDEIPAEFVTALKRMLA